MIPGTWLNDEVVDFRGGLLNLKCKQEGLLEDPEQHSYFIYPSMFWTALVNKHHKDRGGQYTYDNVIKYTCTTRKVIDIFAFDKLFVPINYGNLHWYFAMIHMREERIQIYNSSPFAKEEEYQNLCHLLHYLRDEHARTKKENALPISNKWQLIETERAITPMQKNRKFYVHFPCRSDCISVINHFT